MLECSAVILAPAHVQPVTQWNLWTVPLLLRREHTRPVTPLDASAQVPRDLASWTLSAHEHGGST